MISVHEVKRIGKLRKQLGLTQKQLADRAGVSQSLIAKIESGKIDPAYSKVAQIMAALEMAQDADKKRVDEIMTRTIYSVKPADSVSKAISIMRDEDVSQVPVLESGRCVGSVSEASIMELVARSADLRSTKVAQIMQESLPLVPSNSVMDVAVELLRHYPAVLVDKNGKLAGIVTKADLLKAI